MTTARRLALNGAFVMAFFLLAHLPGSHLFLVASWVTVVLYLCVLLVWWVSYAAMCVEGREKLSALWGYVSAIEVAFAKHPERFATHCQLSSELFIDGVANTPMRLYSEIEDLMERNKCCDGRRVLYADISELERRVKICLENVQETSGTICR